MLTVHAGALMPHIPPPPPPPENDAYWVQNAQTLAAGWTLSEGDYLVQADESLNSIGSLLTHSTGKRYIELEIVGGAGILFDQQPALGFLSAGGQALVLSQSNYQALFSNGAGVFLSSNDYLAYGGGIVITSGTGLLQSGDIVMFALDLTGDGVSELGKLYVGLNGAWLLGCDPATNTNPLADAIDLIDESYMPCMTSSNGVSCRLRAQTAQLAYPVPSGYKAWAEP